MMMKWFGVRHLPCLLACLKQALLVGEEGGHGDGKEGRVGMGRRVGEGKERSDLARDPPCRCRSDVQDVSGGLKGRKEVPSPTCSRR